MDQIWCIVAALLLSPVVWSSPLQPEDVENVQVLKNQENLNSKESDDVALREKKSYTGSPGLTVCVQVDDGYEAPFTICKNEPSYGPGYSNHAGPYGAGYSNYAGLNGAGYSNHLGPNGAGYSNHLGPYGAGLSNHAGPYAAGYSNHAGPYGAGISNHVGPYGAGYSNHAGPYGAGLSNHAGPYGAGYSNHAGPYGAGYLSNGGHIASIDYGKGPSIGGLGYGAGIHSSSYSPGLLSGSHGAFSGSHSAAFSKPQGYAGLPGLQVLPNAISGSHASSFIAPNPASHYRTEIDDSFIGGETGWNALNGARSAYEPYGINSYPGHGYGTPYGAPGFDGFNHGSGSYGTPYQSNYGQHGFGPIGYGAQHYRALDEKKNDVEQPRKQVSDESRAKELPKSTIAENNSTKMDDDLKQQNPLF